MTSTPLNGFSNDIILISAGLPPKESQLWVLCIEVDGNDCGAGGSRRCDRTDFRALRPDGQGRQDDTESQMEVVDLFVSSQLQSSPGNLSAAILHYQDGRHHFHNGGVQYIER